MSRAGSALISLPLIGLLAAVAAGRCAPDDPIARSDDLWPGFRRAAVAALPDAAAIEIACFEAWTRSLAGRAKADPTGIVDPDVHEYPVRDPVCRWEAGSASTADCRFQRAEIRIALPTARERTAALRRTRDRDWLPFRARLVYARTGARDSRWIAPRQCRPVR